MGWGNPVVGGVTLVRPAIQSPDFSMGPPIVGWSIQQNGDVFISGTFSGGIFTSYGGPIGGLYYKIELNAGNLNYYHATSLAGPWIADGTFTDLQQAVSGQPGTQFDAALAIVAGGGGTVTYPPSGDASGITDTTAINAFLSAGWAVRLTAGTYYLEAPVLMPPGGVLEGAGASWANTGGQGTPAPASTVIEAVSGFSGSALVIVQDAILGGYTDQTTNVQLRHFTLNGAAATGTVAGILLHGPVWGTTLEDLGIYKVPGAGISTQGDATNYPSGQSAPYGIHASRVKIDSPGGAGVVLGNATDCQWNMVQVIGAGANGWNFNTSGDHRLVNCSAENGLAIGFNVAIGGVQLVGCRTNLNAQHGASFNGGSATQPPATVTNCRFMADGTSAGGPWYGININNPAFGVHVGESYVSPTGGTTPATALNLAGTPPFVTLSGSLFWGETASGIPATPASWTRLRAVMGATGATPTYVFAADAN